MMAWTSTANNGYYMACGIGWDIYSNRVNCLVESDPSSDTGIRCVTDMP